MTPSLPRMIRVLYSIGREDITDESANRRTWTTNGSVDCVWLVRRDPKSEFASLTVRNDALNGVVAHQEACHFMSLPLGLDIFEVDN